MKNTSILLIAILALFSSCSDEPELIESYIDFTGTYEYTFQCDGPMASENGESYSLSISKLSVEGTYAIDFGDEVIFKGEQSENTLVIAPQTINEDLGFDVVSMEGELRYTGVEYQLDVIHNVDDEGTSTCAFPIVKQ